MRGGHNFEDLTGRRFGRLVVLGRAEGEPNCTCWEVQCDCGVRFVVPRPNLISGGTRSCGCLRRELLKERNYRRAAR